MQEKRLAVLVIAVDDQEPLAEEETVHAIGEVARHLHHQRCVWVRRGPREADASSRELHGAEHVVRDQPARRPDLDGEAVGRSEGAPKRPQERAPRHSSPSAGGRIDAVLLGDLGDRAARDTVAEVQESAADPGATPARVFAGQTHDEASELVHQRRPAGLAPAGAEVPFPGDQGAMPRELRLRRGQRREFNERLAAQRLGGQPALLVPGEAKTPSTESFSEDTVLLAQVIDRRLLLAVHPAGEGEEQDVARV